MQQLLGRATGGRAAAPPAGANPPSAHRTHVAAAPQPASAIDAGRFVGALGAGTALAPALRADMETRFGTDFAAVRVHTDAQAHANAAALQAHAYTRGHDVAFGAGRYAPSSAPGRRLLTHELAHVVQQRRGGAAPALDPAAAHERDADRAADRADAGGRVSVEGATSVGIARDAAGATPDRYLYAFFGNRAWFWGSVGATPEGWPGDDKLRALWEATGVSPKKGKVGPLDDNAMAHKPSFVEFVDTVRTFQMKTMGRSGRAANGVVDPETAARLHAVVPEAAAPATASAAHTTMAEAEAASPAASVESRPSAKAPAEDSGIAARLLDGIKGALVDALLKSIGIPPTGARLATAVGRGMGEQLVQELVHEGKGKVLLAKIAAMGPSDAAQLGKGYYIGLAEGLVSPITDLFGLAVFGERMNNLAKELLVSAFNARGQIGKDVDELLKEVGKVTKGAGEMWQRIKDDPKVALETLLSLPDAISAYAEKKAYELGKSGGSQIVASLEAPWSAEKKAAEASPSPLTSPLGWIESKAKGAEGWMLDTPWSQIGSKIGYAIGFVAIQVILLAFTEGLGNAIEQVAAGLGKVAGALGRLSEAVGTAASRVAELVGTLGKAIAAVEEGIAVLASKALKPIEKFLEPVLEPLGKMFAKLRKFLRDLFGVAEKEGTQLLDTAAAKTAGAADESAKVVPKVEPKSTPPTAGTAAEVQKPPKVTGTTEAAEPKPHVSDKPAPEAKKPAKVGDTAETAEPKPHTPAPSKPAAPFDMKQIGAKTDPPQILNADDFSKVQLKPDQDALYILRDSDGTVLKVGKTSASGAKNRFSVYKRAGKETGKTLQLEVHPLEPSAHNAEFYEKALRTKMEAEGHTLPWDNTGGRLGRPGFGTPGEGVRKPPVTRGEMEELLRHHKGNLREVGKELGVHRRTADLWAKALGLKPQDFK